MLTLWFVMSPAYAWQSSGHKMTAEIAFNLLSEIQQQQVAEILSAHPRFKADFARAMPNEIENGPERERNLWLFERAAIWPEIVRHISEAGRTRYDRSSWHYINLPVYLTKQDEAELADNLTGDVHQPLHNVALFSRGWFPKGDRGGNLIAIRNDDDVTNLHAVWDGLPRRFKDLAPDEETRELLSNDVARIQSISAWAIHYQEMAQEFVYTEEVRQKILQQVAGKQNPEISLTPEYLAAAVELARPQIIIAGHRIAALIRN
jgi:hypothetical protein